MAPEQEDGLAEPRGAERGDLVSAAGVLDEADKPRRRHEALLRGGPADIGRQRRIVGGGPIATELDGDRRPALEQRSRRRVRWSPTCPVSLEPLEVEHARPQTEGPAPDRARGNTATLGDVGHRRTIGEHLRNRVEDHLDARDLARQRVAWEYPLSVPAIVAARQRDRQRREGIRCLEPAGNAAAGQLEVGAAASRATAPAKKVIPGVGEERRVAARLNIEYEDHVLSDGPGVWRDSFRGRRVSSAPISARHPDMARTARAAPWSALTSYTQAGMRVSASSVHDTRVAANLGLEALDEREGSLLPRRRRVLD